MSEWLSTGQMMDQLKIGEKAENNMWDIHKVEKLKNGEIVRIDEENNSDILPFKLTKDVLESKWRILPKYVSFIDAIQAFKGNGKSIANYVGGRVYKYYWDEGEPKCKEKGYDCEVSILLPFTETFEGKWTIED